MKIEITHRNPEVPTQLIGSAPMPDGGLLLNIDNYSLTFTKSESDQMTKDISESVTDMLSHTRWCDQKLNDYVKLLSYASDRLDVLIAEPKKRNYIYECEMENIFHEISSGTFKSTRDFFSDSASAEDEIITNRKWVESYENKHFYPEILKSYALKSGKREDTIKHYPFVNIYNKHILVGFAYPQPIHDGSFSLTFYDLPLKLDLKNGAELLDVVAPDFDVPFRTLRDFQRLTTEFRKIIMDTVWPVLSEDPEDKEYLSMGLKEITEERLVAIKNVVDGLLNHDILKELNPSYSFVPAEVKVKEAVKSQMKP